MEKLINLINEHQKEKHPDGVYLEVVAYRDGIFWSDCCCTSSVMDEIHLISKPCRFIKWLVENDKIDNNKLEKKSDFRDVYYCFQPGKGKKYYDVLIMILAISDTPIEDLISYLR